VEFAFRQPSAWKLHRGQEKKILKPLAQKYAPSVAARRKLGLQVPEVGLRSQAFRNFSMAVLLDPQSLFPRQLMEHKLRQWFDHSPRNLRFVMKWIRLQLWWNAFIAPGSRGRDLASTNDLPLSRVTFREEFEKGTA